MDVLRRVERYAKAAARETAMFLLRNQNNAPYLSQDSLSSLSDYWAYGPRQNLPFDPGRALSAQVIYTTSEQLERLVGDCDLIGARPKVIMAGSSDRNFRSVPVLPESVTLFLCQNNGVDSSKIKSSVKIKSLPIGLENLRLARAGIPVFLGTRGKGAPMDKVLMPPMSPTNPIRRLHFEEASSHKDFHVLSEYLNFARYLKVCRSYTFIFCAEGNGFENHRIWETLYQGSFPVLIRSNFSENLLDLGLPLLLVDTLSEVNPDLLVDHAMRHRSFRARHCDVLWLPYWKSQIEMHSTRGKD